MKGVLNVSLPFDDHSDRARPGVAWRSVRRATWSRPHAAASSSDPRSGGSGADPSPPSRHDRDPAPPGPTTPAGSDAGGLAPSDSAASPTGSRLNLLLSYAGWQPDPWVNRLPRLLEPMGVQSLCAGSGRQASEVLKAHPIHIAIVDLALPLDEACAAGEEGGTRVLDLLARLNQPPPTVVIKRSRSHRDDCRDIAAALRAGAFAVVDRPRDVRDLELMLEVLRRCMGRFYMGRWPGARGQQNPGGPGSPSGPDGPSGRGRGPYIPPNTV